ncbi:MAG: phosphatase PAP2 family protein [Prevotella sp.]|nr:phosphatase PAP2 family protein [Prevotella sp.]
MAIKIGDLFIREKKATKGLLAFEWVAFAYLLFTILMMIVLWDKLVNPTDMIKGRIQFVLVTLALWAVYRLWPCRLTLFVRVLVQMAFLGWWYPDTYEMNRALPNLDHVFAGWEQSLFGCQPSLLFSQKVPYGCFSELMCLGYVSYFPLMLITYIYYFFRRYKEFQLTAFVMLASFFAYYIVFVLLPVTGPQFYYLAVGTEKIAAGIFPNLGDWFLTHSERMAAPGWTDGFWYHMLDLTHDAGERPTAAFPSSHVGVTTVVMLLALRTRSRGLIFTILPFYILMCLSTVYIYAHYAIDAIAGLLSGVLLYFLFVGIYKKYR